MRLKKINATLGLLSILLILLHIGYGVFCYLTFYYNPVLKLVFAYPFMVCVCLHAICGMLIVFTMKDGSRADLYPKQNMRTILQRASAALIFPLLILHINTFSLMQASAEHGHTLYIVLLILAEILFFAVVITHVAVSLTNGLITLGWLTDRELQKSIDKAVYVIGAVSFAISVFAIVKGQVFMFLLSTGG
jgi:hypothetical protein